MREKGIMGIDLHYGKMYKLCAEYVKMMEIRHWLKFNACIGEDVLEDVEDIISGLEDGMADLLRE